MLSTVAVDGGCDVVIGMSVVVVSVSVLLARGVDVVVSSAIVTVDASSVDISVFAGSVLNVAVSTVVESVFTTGVEVEEGSVFTVVDSVFTVERRDSVVNEFVLERSEKLALCSIAFKGIASIGSCGEAVVATNPAELNELLGVTTTSFSAALSDDSVETRPLRIFNSFPMVLFSRT